MFAKGSGSSSSAESVLTQHIFSGSNIMLPTTLGAFNGAAGVEVASDETRFPSGAALATVEREDVAFMLANAP